jgi:hypothetical protein
MSSVIKIPISDLQLKALDPIWKQLRKSQEEGDPGFVMAQITDKGFFCRFISAKKSRKIAEVLGE